MDFAATSVTPIAAPLSPSRKQQLSTPMPPPPPDPTPAKPLVSDAKPALAHSEHVPGVIVEPGASPSLAAAATYAVPHIASTAFPQIVAAEPPASANASTQHRAGAVYGMVAHFTA